MSDTLSGTAIKDAHLRSWMKAFTWRVVGSADTFLLSWLVTGNLVWAGGIATAETVTKIVLFYVHERVWRRVSWAWTPSGRRRALIKGVTWRMVGTADTFLLSWLITGHAGSAATIASFETVTKIVLFYLHEQGWARVPWGREARPAAEKTPVTEAVSV